MRVSKITNQKTQLSVQNKNKSKSHSGNRLKEISFDKSRALLSFGSNYEVKNLFNKSNDVGVRKIKNANGVRYITKEGKIYALMKNSNRSEFETKILDGKHGTSVLLTPKNEKYKGLNILLSEGSEINNKSNTVFVNIPSSKKQVSFAGKFFASVGKTAYPEKMENAYDEFFNKGIQVAIDEMYKSNADGIKDDYNFFVPTDGLGTRLGDVTYAQGGISKPAVPLPAKIAGKDYRLIHNTLSTFTKTGLLNEGYETIKVDDAKGSAYAFLKGLKEGTIGIDKPLVLTWGDAFSDLDLKEVIKEHESKVDAGLTVVGIPVAAKYIGGFAAVGTNVRGQIQKFVEKPKTLEEAEFAKIGHSGNYFGSVGPYIFSKEALSWIKEQADRDFEMFFDNEKNAYDLSSKILMPVINTLNNYEPKEIKNDKGMPLRAYAYQTDCNWSDIGTTSEFIDKMHEVKDYYSHFKLPIEVKSDIRSNVSKEGPIFLNESKYLFKEFCEEYGFRAKGNIIVSLQD